MTTETRTQTHCRALAGALWPDAKIRVGTHDGRHTLEVWATVPPLRGTTRAVGVAKDTAPGAWRALLAALLRRGAREIEGHRASAANYRARAQRADDHAAMIAAVMEEVRDG